MKEAIDCLRYAIAHKWSLQNPEVLKACETLITAASEVVALRERVNVLQSIVDDRTSYEELDAAREENTQLKSRIKELEDNQGKPLMYLGKDKEGKDAYWLRDPYTEKD